MKCVSCGEAEMVRDNREVAYTYKGQTIQIPNVAGEFCPSCNESLHTPEEAEYLNSEMIAFTKEVNGATVKPEFISETRKLLKLDQRQAAEIFGGGTNAFSRYENGKTRPPLALVQLFKLLAKHPQLLDELRPKQLEKTASTLVKSRLTRRKKMLA